MPKRGLLRNIKIDNEKMSCEIHGKNIGLANALRRSLLDLTQSYAVDKVMFQVNTTCMPDEYIAHRLGMIPFLHSSSQTFTEAFIDVLGRNIVSGDIQGADAASENIPIIHMLPNQRLQCKLIFRKSSGIEHSRFCQVAAVGYHVEKDTVHLSFETINKESPLKLFQLAVGALKEKMKTLNYSSEGNGPNPE